MHHISHLHEASASSSAIYLPELLPTGPTLVLVQHTSLLLIRLTPGLSEVRVSFNARLASAKAWGKDTLLVLTDHAAPRLLVLKANQKDEGKAPLSCEATLQLDEALRPAVEMGLGLDVQKALAVAHTHVGTLRVWPTSPDKPNVALAYAVRTPHPHLIAHTLLDTSPPTLALLSISSSPSTLQGLGEQCLPVLSFHSFDTAKQELAPLPWSSGVRAARDKAPGCSSGPTPGPSDSSAQGGAKKYGPAAVGKKRTPAEVAALKAPSLLARAHVPLQPRDAIGAHAMLALPTRSGAAVIVACETTLVLVGCPLGTAAPKSPAQAKRHKASKGAAEDTSQADVLAASPDERFNDNGKRPQRRRSSAAKGVEAANEESKGETSIEPGLWTTQLPGPVQIRAMAVLAEPGAMQDAGLGIITTSEGAQLRVLLATHAGTLLLAEISLVKASSAWVPSGVTVRELGPCPAPAGPGALEYCGEGVLAVACASGDSALLRVPSLLTPSLGVAEESTPVTTLHSIACLAPILDFVADDGAGGEAGNPKAAQARVITASGTGPSGSLRVVRHGAQLETLVELEMRGVSKAWAAGSSALVCSTPMATSVLELGAQISETKTWEIEAQLATLNMAALAGQATAHANSRAVTLLNTHGKATHRWTPAEADLPPDSITLAAFNDSGQALIACRGAHLLYLEHNHAGWVISSRLQLSSEPSALDLSSTGSARAELAAIALWGTRTVQLLRLPNLADVTPTALAEAQPSLPRSLLLHTFAGDASAPTPIPHLLVGLNDGRLASYALSLPTADSMLSTIGVFESRVSTLGSHPLRLSAIKTSRGLDAVLVCGDRPALLWANGTRLAITAVPAREVRHAAPLLLGGDAGADAATLLVLSDALKVVKVGEIEKLDASVAVQLANDNPLALTVCPERKAIAVTTWRFLPQGTVSSEPPLGKVLLYDQNDFAALDTLTLPIDERPNCVTTAHLPDGKPLVLVGTGIAMPDNSETTEGRLLGYYIAPTTRKLTPAFEASVNGNVFAVAQVLGLDKGTTVFAAAVNAEVVTFALTPDDDGDEGDAHMHDLGQGEQGRALEARQVGQWGCAFTACTLSSTATARLIVGDALRSIVVLDVGSATTMRGHLSEVARDCDPYWTTAAELLDAQSETYVGADIAFNLYTTQRGMKSEAEKRAVAAKAKESASAEEAKWTHVMERRGTFHYGDLINKMRRGSLVPRESTNSSPADPRIIFCTAAGALGILTQLDAPTGVIASELERNMRLVLEPLGGIAAEEWRTLRTDHRVCAPTGFVDGDLLARFSALSPDLRDKVLHGPTEHTRIAASPAEIRAVLEALGRVS